MVHYGEPDTPRSDPRQPLGATPREGEGWIGGPVPGAVTWIGMPVSEGWIGGARAAQDVWIGAEQSRPQGPPPRSRQPLAEREVVRAVDRGRGGTGRPVDRAKLPPFLQAHPRFRGQAD